MTVRELLDLSDLQGKVRLVTGENGLSSRIRWVYFADSALDVEDSREVLQYIHGGEMVVFTNRLILTMEDRVLGMLEAMTGKGIAGLFITDGLITPAIERFCREHSLPLAAMAADYHLVDFSQLICRALIEEAQEIHSMEGLISAILFSAEPNKEEILHEARKMHISLSGPFVVICIEGTEKPSEQEDSEDEGAGSCDHGQRVAAGLGIGPAAATDSEDQERRIRHAVKMAFREASLPLPLMMTQLLSVFLLVPEKDAKKIEEQGLLFDVTLKIGKISGEPTIAGVGAAHEYIDGFRRSLTEARQAIRIGKILKTEAAIFRYEDLGIYAMLAQLTDRKFLDDYVEKKLGPLLASDRMQTGSLAKTLEAYLAHNGSISETADSLYIHRNTLRYRLTKISEMLGCDLMSYSQLFEYQLAFAIRRYRTGEKQL